MRHDFRIEGNLFALRPVRRDDAGLIVRLRGDPERARFLHPIVGTLEAQEEFLDRYFERAGDFYFIIDNRRSGQSEGLIAIYNLDAERGSAEIGRWVLSPRSLAAVESIWLLYRIAFDLLGLSEVYCRTVVENRRAVSFHDSCGLEKRALLAGHACLGERKHDVVEHVLARANWPVVDQRLSSLVKCVA